MENEKNYKETECDETGSHCSIQNKVVVITRNALPKDVPNQLFFCGGGFGKEQNESVKDVTATSLFNGKKYQFNRSDVVGTVKPELLPDSAKLALSQIRPYSAADLKDREPQFSGYCFLKNGSYDGGVWLCSFDELRNYVEMQMPYQHRIMICDRDDFCVFEMREGKLIYPAEEDIMKFQKEQEESTGMEGLTLQ